MGLVIVLFFFYPYVLKAQDSKQDSLRNEVELLKSLASQKMDSLRMDVEQKMIELEIRMNDSLMKKQIYMENETAELQRSYQLELEKIQLKADKDSLPANEVDKLVRNLESRLEMEEDALNGQMELEMELLNEYFEKLKNKIEKKAKMEMQKKEKEYDLKMRKLELEL
jgi:hypothetical protein